MDKKLSQSEEISILADVNAGKMRAMAGQVHLVCARTRRANRSKMYGYKKLHQKILAVV